MNRILLATTLALTLIVSSPFACCQTAVEAWVQRYHEADDIENLPRAIAVDSMGSAVVTGSSIDSNGFKYWVTIAYSSSGAALWTNRYHGPGFYDDQANAVAVDAEGNAFVAGVSFGMAGNQDYVVIKYSSAGVGLWTNRYNGPGNGNDGANAVAVDGSGNVIVTGLSVGISGLSSYFDYATVKYSNAGVPLWTNRYNGPANNEDQATDVVVDGSGNVFVTGYSFASNGRSDYLTIAYSSAGVSLWTNRYNGLVNDSDDYARAVAVDGNGNVFVTGESWNGSATDYATIKYSAAGLPLWTNRYHGTLAGNNFATAIALDTNGNVFVTGSDGGFASTNGGYATIKYSPAGEPLWTNHYNGLITDNARAIAVDTSGNVIVTGQSYRDFVTSDIVTVAYSNGGVPLWTNRYNGPANGDDVPLTKRSLALGPNGSVYVTAASDGDFSDATILNFVTIKYVASSPSLSIARSNGLAILSWPAGFSNFQLQENTNVALPNGWSAVAAPRSTNNSFISVALPTTGSRKFFRLSLP
ncbi:MAG: SBBP repeat-containing protein [Verrucomicrobia subdivision 3 bacterium]|nr:SBBP repeat-containing protein [Limisphaerales bacterium]